jgi:toxin-antitoxin system PIN domain toxin
VIAVDTNILVYAHRKDSPWHRQAHSCIRPLAEGRAGWAIPWPCLHEFLAIVTHPRIYLPPSQLPEAIDQIEAWLESPSLVLLAEATSHWKVLRERLGKSRVSGAQIHDARIAALCEEHGVRELWTADRDFSRFTGITTRNPLIG